MIYKIKSSNENNAVEFGCLEDRVLIEVLELNLDTLEWESSSYIDIDTDEFLFVAEQIKKFVNNIREK